jgi:hypothetical protein
MSASDTAAKIAELAETLSRQAGMEARKGIADQLADMIRSPRQFDAFRDGSYLADEQAISPDFVAGLRFAMKALKDKEFDY